MNSLHIVVCPTEWVYCTKFAVHIIAPHGGNIGPVLSKQVLYSYSEISMTHHPYVHPSIYLNDSLCSFQCVFVVVYKHVILSVVVVAVYNLSVFVVVVYKHVIHVRHGS